MHNFLAINKQFGQSVCHRFYVIKTLFPTNLSQNSIFSSIYCKQFEWIICHSFVSFLPETTTISVTILSLLIHSFFCFSFFVFIQRFKNDEEKFYWHFRVSHFNSIYPNKTEWASEAGSLRFERGRKNGV